MDYISRNVRISSLRNAEVQDREALEALLFDWEFYAEKNQTSVSEEQVKDFPGDTYEQKLHSHWLQYGIKEGRTASPYFNATYYLANNTDVGTTKADAYEHFVSTGFWEGRAGSVFYDGENYIYGLNPEKSLLCDHRYHVTATKESTCTSNGSQTTYCCKCNEVLSTVNLPAKEHKDSDTDNYCDICEVLLAGSTLIKSDIDTLVEPVATNEYYDLTGASFDNSSYDGTYYMVALSDDGTYRVFDTVNQSNRGTFLATTVTEKGGAIYGADPDMAITLEFVRSTTANQGIYYIHVNEDYYLLYGNNNAETSMTIGEVRRYATPHDFNLRLISESYVDRLRIARGFSDGKNWWLRMKNINGTYCYRFDKDTSGDCDNSFFLYRLLTDRLHTENMYATIKEARAYVDPSSLYDSVSYNSFMAVLKECIALYERYNGTILTGNDLANREALQESFDAKERELINLMSILKINLEGRTIRYFPANMYNYNEDNMNALVNVMPGADTNGFFFESANNKNTTAYHSVYDSTTNEIVKDKTIRSQMYSITSGIAASDLYGIAEEKRPFASSVVTADFWSETPIEGAKEVYKGVGVPFTFENGYYVLNSDTNAVFFEGQPASGTKLAISERPAAYYWSSGMTYGAANPQYVATDYETFVPGDGYVTAFQPFAKMTNRKAKAYTAEASVFEATQPVDSYLLDGVAFISQTTPAAEVTGSGKAVWGFGMKLDVDFKMTDDGRLMDANRTPITFEFSGDDDVWVYIDDKLVLDIGGSHDAIQGVIDFTNGNVIVRSDKYDRVRDKNPDGYGWSDADKYDPALLSDVHAIVNNQMYQKNLYAEVFGQTIKQFADNGKTHTLTVYYMDRGKGRTNSMIKFNLPQTDTLTVNKDVKCATYANGALKQMTEEESAKLTPTLSAMNFEYTLTDDGKAVANQSYQLLQNGVDAGEKTTDANGKFFLKDGQSAVFTGLNFTAANKYKVVETTPTDTWFNIEWTHSTTGNAPVNVSAPTVGTTTYNENTSATIYIDGDLHANETITFNCTNTFAQVLSEVDEIIVDYGKTMHVDVLANDPSLLYINGYVRQLQGFADFDENLDPFASLKTPGKDTYTTQSGDFSIVNGQVQFVPKKLLDTVERLFCVVEYSKGSDVFYVYEELRLVPANVMYYETDFGEDVFKTEERRDFVFLDFGPDDTTTWTYIQNATVTRDRENGLLLGDITGGDPFVGMQNGSKQLHYVTKPGDVIIMRMKTTRLSEGGNSTGYEVFLSFTDTNTKSGWELVRDEEHEQGSGEFEILTLNVPSEMIGRTLEEFRFDPFWNGDGNKVIGTYELDYVYIGQPANAPSSDYLFFDFTNDTEDGLRYKQPQYGGVNFDQGNWVLGNGQNATAYTIDEEAGTLSLKLSSDASKNGPYLSVTNGRTNDYPWSGNHDCGILNFDARNAEVLKVRFKLVNCTKLTDDDTTALFLTHFTRNGENGYYGDIGKNTVYTYQENEWITVTANIGYQFQTGDIMNTVGVWFPNLTTADGGEIIVDYIYVGKADDFTKALTHNRSTWTTVTDDTVREAPAENEGNLFFDFTNDEEDELRYQQAQYGGVNFDIADPREEIAGPWCQRSQTLGATTYYNSIGVISAPARKNQTASAKYAYYFQASQNMNNGYVLQYNPAHAEAIYVRAKLENFTAHGTPEFMVNYYVGNSGTETIHYISEKAKIDNWYLESGEYFTVRISATELQSHSRITALRFNFNNIDNTKVEAGRITVDYIYVGSEKGYVEALTHSHGANNPDDLQDSGLANNDNYLLLDFNGDDKTVWNWLNGATVTKDTASGVLRGKLTGGDTWIGMARNSRQLDYTFKKGDVLQVRLKTNIVSTDSGRTGLQLYFMNSKDNAYYEVKDNEYDHITGEYEVVTLTIPERCWGMNACNIRIDPIANASGKQLSGDYEIDYIYLGQPNRAPGFSADQKDFLLFTFDQDDLSNARYRHPVYGGFDGDTDPWSCRMDKNTELFEGDDEGTKAFSAAKGNTERYHYIRSSADGLRGYSLNHKPSIDDVLQVRVKFENFKIGNTNPYMAFKYYTGDDIYNEVGEDAGVVAGHFYFDPAYLNAGEYVTLTMPMNQAYAAVDRISNFCVFFNEMVSISDELLGKVTIDYIYLGTEETAPDRNEMVIGYDSSYENDILYSNGSSFYAEGIGVPSDKTIEKSSYNGTSFTFTGTGFDLLSRTGTQQGSLRILVFDENGTLVKNTAVLNKSEKDWELYQIPVISVEIRDLVTKELVYGTYTAHIFVNAAYDYGNDGNADDFHGGLDRGGEFYFDAVRIYNPVDTSSAACATSESSRLANEAYQKVSEADRKQTEVRQYILDKGNFKADGNVEGILYLDNTDAKVDIGTYAAIGPNNETYLAENQGIAFKIVTTGVIPDSIDIGAKTVNGEPASMRISASAAPPSAFGDALTVGLTSSTLQNYSLEIPASAWYTNGSTSYTYITVYNSKGGILSLADIKCAYDSVKPAGATRSVRFLVDLEMLDAMLCAEPVVDENLQFGEQLALENDLTLSFRLNPERIAQYDISTMYLEVERDVYGSDGSQRVETVVLDRYEEDGNRLVFKLTGIAAAQMNDGIRATLHIKDAKGKEYVSPVRNTSVTTYLRDLLQNSSPDSKLVTLIMDMLNYGTAAQIYFDRHADAPAREAFEIFKAYESCASADFASALEDLSGVSENAGATGKLNLTLDLGTRIGIRYKLTLPADAEAADVTLVVTDAEGNVLETLAVADSATDSKGRYLVDFYGSTSRDMRRVVYATAYADGEAITGTYAYSISTYAWGIQENAATQPEDLVNVTRMMLLYGDSTASYFAG